MYKLTHVQYFEALKENVLKGLKCLDCGTITVPPKAVCDDCGSTNQEITQLSGDGTIRTFTVIRVAPEGFKAPYVVVLAQLREGPWLTGLLNSLRSRERYHGNHRQKSEIGAPGGAAYEAYGRRGSRAALFPG